MDTAQTSQPPFDLAEIGLRIFHICIDTNTIAKNRQNVQQLFKKYASAVQINVDESLLKGKKADMTNGLKSKKKAKSGVPEEGAAKMAAEPDEEEAQEGDSSEGMDVGMETIGSKRKAPEHEQDEENSSPKNPKKKKKRNKKARPDKAQNDAAATVADSMEVVEDQSSSAETGDPQDAEAVAADVSSIDASQDGWTVTTEHTPASKKMKKAKSPKTDIRKQTQVLSSDMQKAPCKILI